jgi:hypothetical protein
MQNEKDEQEKTETSELSYGQKFVKEWRAKPYSTDRIGQFTIKVGFTNPLKEIKKKNKI